MKHTILESKVGSRKDPTRGVSRPGIVTDAHFDVSMFQGAVIWTLPNPRD